MGKKSQNTRGAASTPSSTSSSSPSSSRAAAPKGSDKQINPQAVDKQKKKATNSPRASPSNSDTPSSSTLTLEYKLLKIEDLKPGDMFLVVHHSVPKNTDLFHWMIYVHLGANSSGRVLHATLFSPSGDPKGPFFWKFEMKPHTLWTQKLAYARYLGNFPDLTSKRMDEFKTFVKQNVPVPYIEYTGSSYATFTCRTWALEFTRFMRDGNYIGLPYSVGRLEKEMSEKGTAQAEKANACYKLEKTSKGTKATFPGYRPLIEGVKIVAASH